jgi:hypothetical protein
VVFPSPYKHKMPDTRAVRSRFLSRRYEIGSLNL